MKTMALTLLTAALAAPAVAQTPYPLAQAKTVQVMETTYRTLVPAKSLQPVNITTVKMERPGFVRIEQKPFGALGPDLVLVSDRKTMFQYNAGRKQFYKYNIPSPGRFLGLLPGVFQFAHSVKPTLATLNGKTVLLFVKAESSRRTLFTKKLWIDAATGLPCRQSFYLTRSSKATEAERILFTNWVLNAPLPPSTFQFTPPAGAKEVPK